MLAIAELLRSVEQLAAEECRHGAVEPRLSRLAAMLWVARDVADELVEAHVAAADGGRAVRRDQRERSN